MKSILLTFGGLYELLRLSVISRFRFRGAYWQWRMDTAFGRGKPASRWEMIKAVLDYGKWIHQMRMSRPS